MSPRILLAAGLFAALAATEGPHAGHTAASTQVSDRHEPQAVSLRQVTWDEARPLVERFDAALPDDLRRIPAAERPARWAAWVESRRAAVAERIARGEDDSVVNLLLFGTSFTREPRVTPAFLAGLEREWHDGRGRVAQDALLRVYTRRASDLVAVLARPGDDERLRLARATLERRGLRVTTAADRARTEAALLADVARVKDEAAAIGQTLERAARLDDSDAALAERSRAFRDRGLAPDTTVLTQYAVDRALDAVRRGGLLDEGAVRRVAIVGPGLDFADKQEGYDFYPPQTLQPFAVADSLVRAGLGRLGALQVTTIDVSPRVNDHLRRAVSSAASGADYRLVLPLDTAAGWREEAIAYWKVLAAPLGRSADQPVPAGLPHVRARGVAVAPSHVERLRVLEGNIVFERADLSGDDRFDLVITTNVLLYYDAFEQALALANIATLLRPDGILLTNTVLLEVPEIPMRSAGYVTVPYSDRPGDGERIVIYRKPM